MDPKAADSSGIAPRKWQPEARRETRVATLAMVHRKSVHYHARYMIATALVFLVPGLSRTMGQYVAPSGFPALDFYQCLYVPLAISLALVAWEWRTGRVRSPFIVFSVLWAAMLVLWHVLPHLTAWQRFTAWAASVGG